MEFLKKWFGESSDAGDAPEPNEPERYSVRATALREKTLVDEYQDDSSFTWNATGPVSSNIFDAPPRRIAQAEDQREDEDTGYDPYDTGRFV
jgi:hypothetical protein